MSQFSYLIRYRTIYNWVTIETVVRIVVIDNTLGNLIDLNNLIIFGVCDWTILYFQFYIK